MLSFPLTAEDLGGLLRRLEEDSLLSPAQAAIELGVEEKDLLTWVADGRFPAEEVDGQLVIRYSRLLSWFVRGTLRLQLPHPSLPEVLA